MFAEGIICFMLLQSHQPEVINEKTGEVVKQMVLKCMEEQKVIGRVRWDATEHGNYWQKRRR